MVLCLTGICTTEQDPSVGEGQTHWVHAPRELPRGDNSLTPSSTATACAPVHRGQVVVFGVTHQLHLTWGVQQAKHVDVLI